MKKLLFVLLTVLLLTALLAPVSALAEDEINGDGFYVIDLYGLLSESEVQTLTSAAENITKNYGCGVHIGVIGDMRDFGFYDIEDCAEEFFNSFGLGVDPDHTGILLILSMAERDYDIDAHGEFAHYAFTDYGKTTISDEFLDNFRQDDWFGGFLDYLSRCETMLQLARDGHPVDVGDRPVTPSQRTGGMIVSALVALLIAWFVCSALKGRNKSVRAAVNADAYVPTGAVTFRVREDRFVNRTVTRRRIERSERSGGGGGGTTISSGGHSHSSGKF